MGILESGKYHEASEHVHRHVAIYDDDDDAMFGLPSWP